MTYFKHSGHVWFDQLNNNNIDVCQLYKCPGIHHGSDIGYVGMKQSLLPSNFL